MGCATCGKSNKSREAARGKTIYLKCIGCGTLLHGRKKDMKRIDGNLVCGECFKRYKNMTTKPKNIKGKAPSRQKRSKPNDNSRVE